LSSKSYFYGALIDAAKGNKKRLLNHMKQIEDNYVIDLLHSKEEGSYITSTSPCVIAQKVGLSKNEILFPISPKFCVRFIRKTIVRRNGKYYEQTIEEVKKINRIIADKTNNIVISERKYINDII
jgi:hypothetical protein